MENLSPEVGSNDTTTSVAPQEPISEGRRLLAPLWHTLLLIAIIVATSILTANTEHKLSGKHGKIAQYITTIVWQWLLTAYVWWGLRRKGFRIGEVIGRKWKRFEDVLLDIGLAAGFWFCAAMVLVALAYLLGLAAPDKIRTARQQLEFLVPQSGLETAIWLALSCTAGFCEEIIFRGYLQRQFTALAGSTLVGLAAQSICFGAAHGYEGRERMLMIGVYGLMFGLLALWRKSLRPGMMAHAWHDALSGIASRFVKM